MNCWRNQGTWRELGGHLEGNLGAFLERCQGAPRDRKDHFFHLGTCKKGGTLMNGKLNLLSAGRKADFGGASGSGVVLGE